MCTTILLSASSWSQSSMGTDIPHEDTDFPDVAYRAFVGGQLNASIFDVRYANNSFWQAYEDVTEVFAHIANRLSNIGEICGLTL